MRIVPNKSFQSRPIQWYRRLKPEISVRNNHGKPQGLQDTNDLCTGSTHGDMEIPMLSIPTLLAMSVILDENAWQSIHWLVDSTRAHDHGGHVAARNVEGFPLTANLFVWGLQYLNTSCIINSDKFIPEVLWRNFLDAHGIECYLAIQAKRIQLFRDHYLQTRSSKFFWWLSHFIY